MTKPAELFLTTTRAALRLGITPCRVRVLIREGRLPVVNTASRAAAEKILKKRDE